jgi:2-polyprenyl-3-methyl-5-hydroxy-6-metoxy-1,4-benzoquinol methylase
MAATKSRGFRFDRQYYQRYYYDRRTAVNSREDMRRLARYVVAFTQYLDLPVRRILDAGCGCGWLRAPFARLLPSARYTGLEYSEYLCERYGWTQGSVASFRARHRFDLVTCNGVLQYLDDRAAARAIANLGRLCSGVLYFNALTAEDWRSNADRTLTDGDVHIRDATWYRTRLQRAFIEIGGGLWLRRGSGVSLWSLEHR